MSEDKDTTPITFRLEEPPSWGDVMRARAKAAARRHYLRNKDRINHKARVYQSENWEKCNRSRMNSNMRKLYGITLEERDALIVSQDACLLAVGGVSVWLMTIGRTSTTVMRLGGFAGSSVALAIRLLVLHRTRPKSFVPAPLSRAADGLISHGGPPLLALQSQP